MKKPQVTTIKEDGQRDLFFFKIYFESDDGQKKSTVFAAASREYFEDNPEFKGRDKNLLKEEWRKKVVRKYNSFGEDIFLQKIHYHADVFTQEGHTALMNYLMEKL